MPNQEQLFGATFRGPASTKASSASSQFAGRTTVPSGSATVTISTTVVQSDSLIDLNLQSTSVSSGALCVRSIAPGAAMTIGWSDGAARAFDATAMWRITLT